MLAVLSLPTWMPRVTGTYFGKVILFFTHKFEGTVLSIIINIDYHSAVLYINIYTYMNANYVIIGDEHLLCLVKLYGGVTIDQYGLVTTRPGAR